MRAVVGVQADPAPVRPTRHRAPNVVLRLARNALTAADGPRSAAVAMGMVVLVVAVMVAVWVLSSRPRAIPVPAASATVPVAVRSSTTSGRAPVATDSPARSSGVLVVDVAGKVRRPGLYRLAAGARVDDALRAAGGVLPGVDLASVNLAALVADGQQIAVGVAPAAGTSAAGSAAAGGASAPVHLNSATIDQLEALAGVGPVLAQHIIDYRSQHGSFASVTQLNDVPGIGAAKFAALRDAVSL